MALTANIYTDVNGNVIIPMHGHLNYEINAPLKKELEYLLKTYPTITVTLDFQSVEFVGSSGISTFVDLVNGLNSSEENKRLRLSNVKSEFMKIFRLYQLQNLELIIDNGDRYRSKNDFSSTSSIDRLDTIDF